MAQKFYVDIDLNNNQLLNAVLHKDITSNLTSLLSVAGKIAYDSTREHIKYRTETTIVELATLTLAETFTNKTLTSPVLNSSVSGSAIVTYTAGGIAQLLSNASDDKLVSEKAVRAAIENGFAANDAMKFKGGLNASTNPNYPEAVVGDTYRITAAGKIGGSTGFTVEVGDTLICAVSSAAGNHATVAQNWIILQYNIDILPVSKGGIGSSLALVQGALIYASSTTGYTVLEPGANNTFLRILNGVPTWASFTPVTSFLTLSDTPSNYTGSGGKLVRVKSDLSGLEFYNLPNYDNYEGWNFQVNATTPVLIASGHKIQYLNGAGINLEIGDIVGGKSLTVGLSSIAANSLWINATSAAAVPSSFAISANTVLGRLGSNIVNIPFGTGANQIAWGNHSHTQLHNRSHDITSSSDHTASGLVVGQFLQATGASSFAWSALRLPTSVVKGDMLLAANDGEITALAKATTNKQFITSRGADNLAQWGLLELEDMPNGVPKYYVSSYENAGAPTTSLLILSSTHGCGTKPVVQFFETIGTSSYQFAQVEISVRQDNGDITISTATPVKGKVIIVGS